MMTWFVYILLCSDATFYVGSTNNLARRVDEHNISDKGAKYTRGRRPVALVYHENGFAGRGDALRREKMIKKMGHDAKEKLFKG